MGSKQSTNQNTNEQSLRRVTEHTQRKASDVKRTLDAANRLQGIQSNLPGFQRPGLQFNNQPFSQQFEPLVNFGLARGTEDILNRQAASDRSLASALSIGGVGDNTALINALQRQGAVRAAGATNALFPAALEQQRGFDLAREEIERERNKLRLGQSEILNNFNAQIAAERLRSQLGLTEILARLQEGGTSRVITERGQGSSETAASTKKSFF